MNELDDTPPYQATAWWAQARTLQAQGRLEEALALVEQACGGDVALAAQSELLAAWLRRALAAGHLSDALRAHERAARACRH